MPHSPKDDEISVPSATFSLARASSSSPPVRFAVSPPRLKPDPANIDHFWITIDAGKVGSLEIAINTFSRRNSDAGFDGRMRVAIVATNWAALPTAGLMQCDHLDYGEFEAQPGCNFSICERSALEQLLGDKARRAIFVEAWGELWCLILRLGHRVTHAKTFEADDPATRR